MDRKDCRVCNHRPRPKRAQELAELYISKQIKHPGEGLCDECKRIYDALKKFKG